MADVKISALPASTVPLGGTEVLPIVQGGTTKQVSVANLTAGRAIAATNVTATGTVTAIAAATQDAVALTGRAGGTGSFVATITPTTLSASRSFTLPDAAGTIALTANKLSAFAATTSAELAGVISDETGTGSLVFADTPTLVTPVLGTPTSGDLANCTFPTLNQNTTGSSGSVKSNATTGLLQITGPAAASTRVMTTPDADFTAARTDAANSFTGDQTLSTGNLVIGTSGKGIDFSATPGTGTSELFADYEEGTFTPTFSCDTGTVTVDSSTRTATYTKIGRQVTVNIFMAVDSVSSPTGNLYIDGLPFTSASSSACALFPNDFALTAVTSVVGLMIATLNYVIMRTYVQGSAAKGLAVDTVSGSSLRISLTYFV